jgi:hypothetical protein
MLAFHRSSARRVVVAQALVVLATLAPRTRAQAATPPDPQLAEARRLFAQAEADEDAGRWADALGKLYTVAEVRRTAGIRYHIALCEEHLGQLVRALADYEGAQTQARDEKARDVLRLVGKQLAGLEPRVPHLAIHLVPDVPDASVWVDDAPVDAAARTTPLPVDPGVHHVEATAPQRPTSSVHVTLQEGETTVLEIQLGQPSPAAAPAPTVPASNTPARADSSSAPPAAAGAPTVPAAAPPPAVAAPSRPRGFAIALTTISVALAGGGIAAFVLAGVQHDDAVRACAGIFSTAPDACDSLKNGVRALDVGAASAWAAAAVAGIAATVLWTRPAPAGAALALRWGPAAIALEGRF